MAAGRDRPAAAVPAPGGGEDRGAAAAAAAAAAALLRRGWSANRARLAASASVLALCALLLPWEREPFQAAFGAVANLLACNQFAATLLPGREPLISRYTRFDFGHLPPDCAAYTRNLTLLWAVLLAGFAAAQAVALAGGWQPSAVLAVEALVCGALFLGEHGVRGLRFPHHGRATVRRTVRAVRLAHAARDAAAG
jgi:uncharacterized membrane protein